MPDIKNDLGEVIIASPVEQTIPVEYAGMTCKEIYDAMCIEHGLDPAVRDGKLVPRYSYTSPSDLFTLTGNVFYDVGNPNCHIQGIAPTIHFYSQSHDITSSTHRNIDMTNVGIVDSTGVTFPVSAAGSLTPWFSIHMLPNFGRDSYGLHTDSTSNSNPSVNLFYFKDSSNRFEMVVRIKLSGEIDAVIKNDNVVNVPKFGFLTYLTDEGSPVPASAPIFDPVGTTAWRITDTDIHYYKSPEVERAFIKGIVQNGAGNFLSRKITVLDGETKGVRNVVNSSAADGSFSVSVSPDTEYMVICEDQGIDAKNALVFDRVIGLPDA